MKRYLAVTLSLIFLMVLTTAVAFAQSPDPGSASVNFTVQNLDSGGEAAVTAQYVNTSGTVDATVNKTLDALSSDGFPISDSGLPDNWEGSVVVSADKEIGAFAQILWSGGNSSDGKTAGAYNGFTQGATTLYLPSLAARTTQYSRVTVQSAEQPGSGTTSFTINYYDRSGNLTDTVNDSVAKGAQKTFDLSDNSNLSDWLGSAVITSGDPLAAAATTHWAEYSAAYSAVSGGGQTAYLPSATRRIPSGTWLQYTSVIVQNLDTGSDATVTVHWYDRDGTELHSFNDTIPANSSHGYNTRFTTSDVPDHTALHTALGDDWNGSVVVESTGSSPADVVAIVNLQWTVDHPSSAAAAAYYSESAGTSTVYVPATFRRQSGSWLQYSGLIVQNVGGSTCSNFNVDWRDRDGATLLSYTDSLDPNIAHGYNTRQGADIPGTADLNSLGSDFRGSVVITSSGCELVGIHNTVWPAQTDNTTYNAIGQ